MDQEIRAWVEVDRSGALSAAARMEAEIREGGWKGPLHGIPLGVKDIVHVEGFPTRAGSRVLANVPPADRDSTVVAKLREAGAVILGKTVTTEFACFDPAETRNPWDLSHTPGGSSSGSAAAVAADMCFGAIGSQTGGPSVGLPPIAESSAVNRPMAECPQTVSFQSASVWIIPAPLPGPYRTLPFCCKRSPDTIPRIPFIPASGR